MVKGRTTTIILLMFLMMLVIIPTPSVFSLDIVAVEPVLDCIKTPFNFWGLQAPGIVDFFVGERMTVTLHPSGPNYAALAAHSPYNNGTLIVTDTAFSNTSLVETVCSAGYGLQYGGYGGLLQYSLQEIESAYALPQHSLYIERYKTVPGLYSELRDAFIAYRIPGALSYADQNTFGPTISYNYLGLQFTPQGTFQDISVYVEPFDISSYITQIFVYGPLPGTLTPAIINSSNPTGYGQAMTFTFRVPANSGNYDAYHIQALDSFSVGTTEWVTVP